MDIFGYLSAICFFLCYFPQIRKTHRTKSVGDISLGLWLLNWSAYMFGLAYGIGISAIPLILNYSNGLICGSIILWQYWRYRK